MTLFYNGRDNCHCCGITFDAQPIFDWLSLLVITVDNNMLGDVATCKQNPCSI